jgi:hypothetical protein
VEFLACAEYGNEAAYFVFECAAGKIGAVKLVEMSDAEAREDCNCVAV